MRRRLAISYGKIILPKTNRFGSLDYYLQDIRQIDRKTFTLSSKDLLSESGKVFDVKLCYAEFIRKKLYNSIITK